MKLDHEFDVFRTKHLNKITLSTNKLNMSSKPSSSLRIPKHKHVEPSAIIARI
jgi:hypothetical protein